MEASSNIDYYEAGMKHPDTVISKDKDEDIELNKITSVKVHWSEYCVAFEVFYNGSSAGARLGTEYKEGDEYTEIVLGDDEYITEVEGRSGNLIDQVTLKTNKGKVQNFGTSTGGSPFSLSQPGKVVKGFTVGFGGHLHFIGAHFGALEDSYSKSEVAGKSSSDTVKFDDYESELKGKKDIEMTKVNILHDNNSIVGVEATYAADGVEFKSFTHSGKEITSETVNEPISLSDAHITGISGKIIDSISSLTISLSNGTDYSFGGTKGTPFQNILPEGKKVIALGGSLGANLHNIFCYYQ